MIRSILADYDVDLEKTFIPTRNAVREDLEKSIQNNDMIWIDIVEPTIDEISWLVENLNLHPSVEKDLMQDDLRPSLMVYKDYIFLSLFQPKLRDHRVIGAEIHCIMGSNFFVTVRRSQDTVVDDVYNRIAQNTTSWQRGVAYFLYLTAQHVVDAYYPMLDRISHRLNNLEDTFLNDGRDSVSQKTVYRIKQELITMRQMVAPQREVLASVLGESRVASTQTDRDLFRHLYERLLRVYDVIDSQRDLTSSILDLMNSSESKKLADAMNRLTIFSMIFLPLTFFTGFFDLNFATTRDPFTLPISGQWMFGLIILSMLVSSLLMYGFFRYRKWL